MPRRRLAAAGWLVGTFVVVAGGWWAGDRMTGTEPGRCDVVAARVVDAPAIEWDDGTTGAEPSWIIVLTDGVEQIAPDLQPALADAVAADDEGYADLREALPSSARPVADRQRARVLDPRPAASRRADPEVRADIAHLRRAASEGCTFAP